MRTTIEKCSLKKKCNLSFKRLYSETNKKAQLSILKKHIDGMHIYAYDFDSQTLIDGSHISHSHIHQLTSE